MTIDLLWKDLKSNSVIKASIALLCLIAVIIGRRYLSTAIIGAYGVPLFLSILRYELEFFVYNKDNNIIQSIDYFIQGIVFIAILIFSFLIKEHIALWNDPAFITKLNLIAISLTITILIKLVEKSKIFSFDIRRIYSYLLVLLFVYLGITNILSRSITQVPWKNIDKADAYYETQVWARGNTQESDLFMVDPSIDYGWEAYSKRAKFGSFRELIHTGWLYTGNGLIFEEGMRRIRLFNVEPEDYLRRSLENQKKSVGPEYREFASAVDQAFYTFEDMDLENIAVGEGIAYFVFDKKKITKTIGLPVAYENEYFIVHKHTPKR